MAVTKRCIRCRKKVRVPEGTCQNPACVLYVPDPAPEPTTETNDGGNTKTEPTP